MRAIDGDIVSDFASEELVDRHPNAPFAYPALREQLRQVAVKAVTRYLAENRALLPQTRYSEQQVQVHVAPRHHGGRPDRPLPAADTNETSVVDFKSSARNATRGNHSRPAAREAVGYEELTRQPG